MARGPARWLFPGKPRINPLSPRQLNRAFSAAKHLASFKKPRSTLHSLRHSFATRPGKPTDNAYIEAFNSRLRQECLNASWFLSMDDARTRINSWKEDYNETRPHSSLEKLTPSEFAAQLNETRKVT
ncbi:integrase core domain-containing protein [Ruegeria sp. 2012CJ41-6]|uniref:Integrase core domain-containing protein n=1 Tax=Ruegeria spongiae TaxID=2942209 RepID=A0ABT0Q786_9RHOB|nr:integrase core domain-containing protein [Ruegeria spongiae]MCL6285744.1 integrase core domain-containing protein [Ruegeria spongiae]